MAEPTPEWRLRAAATKRRRTRSQLVAAATALFEEVGYQETSVEQVAARARVGAGSVYNHFSGKAELAAAAFQPLYEQLETTVDDLLAAEPFDIREAVRSYHETLVGLIQERRALAKAVVLGFGDEWRALPRESPPGGTVRAIVPLHRPLARLLVEGRGRGQLGDGVDVTQLAVLLSNGLMVTVLEAPASFDVAMLLTTVCLRTCEAR